MKKLLVFTAFLLMAVCLQFPFKAMACEPGQLPETYLYFIENKGQWNDNIKYQVELNAARLFLEGDKLTYVLVNPADMDYLHDAHHNPDLDISDFVLHCHAFQVHFGGDINLPTAPQATCNSDAYRNYFIDKDPSKWKSHVGLYQQIDYYNLYNGIDLRFYGDGGHVKYDYIVAPGANASQIQLVYDGLDGLFVQNGNLHMLTSVNTIIEQQPYAYQYINGQLTQVPCFFSVSGNTVTFNMPDGYDTSEELIIDPTLIFSTYTGATSDNWGFTATYDNTGHLYAGGAAFGVGYPTTTGAFQINFAGGDPVGPFFIDISVSKFTPDGSNLIYSTYLGGSASTEIPQSMIVSPQNELIVYGTTGSVNFPTTPGCFDDSFNGGFPVTFNSMPYQSGPGSDIIVSKFNADGSALVGSTYIGGVGNDGLNLSTALKRNYADEARGEVFIDAGGNIYLASSTNSPDFPATEGVISEFAIGGQDACLIKLNPSLTNMIWGTYLGGTSDDAAYSLKMDDSETLYVCGGTNSNNFPIVPGAYDATYNGGTCDAWLAKISTDGSTLLASTYLGTPMYDQSFFIDIDEELNVYTVGQTAGIYPISPGVYSNPNSGQYLQKLSNDLSTSLWSTTFGNGNGSPNISPSAFLVDNCYQIYVSGWGGNVNGSSPGSTTNGLPVTPDAYDSATDGSDYYFIVLGPNASTLIYATFFGSPSGTGEHVDGGTSRFDKQGIIYQAVCAGCGSSDLFPTTPGAWSNTNNSTNCNLGCLKFAFEVAPTVAEFTLPPPGCAPYTVAFSNTSTNALEYTWNFGDGSATSTEVSPTHTFAEPGTYTVTLLAVNPGTCNGSDETTQTVVILGEQEVTLTPLNFCPGDSPALLSASLPGGTWSGTGVVNPATGLFNPAGLAPGAYTVTYTVGTIPTCTSTATTTVTVNGLPDPSFTDQNGVPVNGNIYCITDAAVTLVPTTEGAVITGTAVSGNVFTPASVPQSLLNTPININLTVEVNGCPNASVQTVTVIAPPNPAFTSFNFCQGAGPAIFEPVTPGGSWSGTGIDPATGIFSPIGLTPGIYTVSYTVGETGCNATASADVVVSAAEAGTMPADLQIVCSNQQVTITNFGDEILEEGQGLYYILHTNAGETAGTVLAQNTTGTFDFGQLNGAEYYNTYYISAVASLPDGNGGPLLSDPCIDIAAGTPVVFLAPITLEVDEYCDWLTGDYHVVIAPQGGYPGYDAASEYTIMGDFFGNMTIGTSMEIVFPEGSTTTYLFEVSDITDCDVAFASEDFFCTKTPVELLYFTGKAVDEGSLLTWATATETDNDFYTLWRSADGQNFTKIMQIDAAGTSITGQNYQYLDRYTSCAPLYYRLTQTDVGGSTRNLGIVSITRSGNNNLPQGILISPVPATNNVTLQFANTGGQNNICLFDVTGKLVLQTQGGNTADCVLQTTLDISRLTAGMYMVRINGDLQTISAKLVVK